MIAISEGRSDFRFSASEGTQNPVLARVCGFDPLLRQSLYSLRLRPSNLVRPETPSPMPSVYPPVELRSKRGLIVRDKFDWKIAAAWLIPLLIGWGLALWFGK